MKRINPNYKEYKRTPLNDKPFTTFKLPEEVQKDFNEYLKAFPNRNKGMMEIIIDVLNSKCTERKYYNIDVVSILPVPYTDENSKIGCFIAGKDNYLMEREGLSINSSSIILNNETYLNPSKELSLEDFSVMLNNNHFTDSEIEPVEFDVIEEFEEYIQEHYYLEGFNFYNGFSLVHFKINNFLDEFIDNEYKISNGNHKGLGYFKLNYIEELCFFSYEWKFKEDFSFELVDVVYIDETEFKALILNSSNDELKQFLKGFKDLSSYEEAISDVPVDSKIDELKKENMELRRQLEILEDYVETVQEENVSLKLENTELYQEGYDKGKDETEESIRNRFREILKENNVKLM